MPAKKIDKKAAQKKFLLSITTKLKKDTNTRQKKLAHSASADVNSQSPLLSSGLMRRMSKFSAEKK